MYPFTISVLIGLSFYCCNAMAAPTTGINYIGAEYLTKYCGDSIKNLCMPLSGGQTSVLTVEAGGKAYDGIPDPFHAANRAYYSLDFDAPQNTTLNVTAARGGIVTRAKVSGNNAGDVYWPVVRIDHGDGYFTEYAEFSSIAPTVRVGDRVEAGSILGTLTSPNQRSIQNDHLHFQVRFDPNYDPRNPSDGSTALSGKSVAELSGVRVGGRLIEDFKLTRTDGVGTIIRHEAPIIEGKGTGIFSNPNPFCGANLVTCSGLGTNSIRWGSAGFSQLIFSSTPFVAEVGTKFQIGNLQFTNGGTRAGSEILSIKLQLNTNSTDHTYADNLDLSMIIDIVSTPNSSDEFASADYIYFRDFPEFGSFRVKEGRSTSVPVYAMFGSLHFAGIGPVANSDAGFVAPVSEPGTLLLVGAAIVVISVLREKRLT